MIGAAPLHQISLQIEVFTTRAVQAPVTFLVEIAVAHLAPQMLYRAAMLLFRRPQKIVSPNVQNICQPTEKLRVALHQFCRGQTLLARRKYIFKSILIGAGLQTRLPTQ